MNSVVDIIGSQTRARKFLCKNHSENNLKCLISARHCAGHGLIGLKLHISNIHYDKLASKILSKFLIPGYALSSMTIQKKYIVLDTLNLTAK